MSRHVILASIALLVLLALSLSALGASSYRVVSKQNGMAITGVARNIDRLREFFDVSDHANTYTVLTGRASIQLRSGRMGTTQDLEDNDYVRIVGDRLSERTVLATSIVVIDAKTAAAEISAISAYRPRDRVESAGVVTRVAARFAEIDVRTDTGNYVIIVRPETIMRRYLYPTDINDVGEGDEINFIGTMSSDGRILAERLQVSSARSGSAAGKSYRAVYLAQGSRPSQDTVEGAIITPPSMFDRTLVVQTRYGERQIDVLKNAEVRIDGRLASVHDLTRGDSVRVYGTWDSSTMIANRVETIGGAEDITVPEPPRAPSPAPAPKAPPAPAPPDEAAAPAEPAAPEPPRPNTLTGRIVDIDYTNLDLTIDAAMVDTKIDAREAAVTRKGSSRRFSELKKGDKVEVKGDWTEDVMKAASIDVVE